MQHKLVVTGSDPVPVEINSGVVIKRHDMATTHEEGDTIIVQQVASVEAHRSLVVADDTDIFILLLHFSYEGDISFPVTMVSPIHDRAVIDIDATVEKHRAIIPDLLAAHGLTGCDTVASYHGIGKGIALKVLRSGQHSLSCLGDSSKPLSHVTKQATKFMLACYNQSRCRTMTEARQKMWLRKVGQSKACAPSLQTLPPTTEAFKENVARAQLQVAVWRNTLEPNPPAIDPTAYGWAKEQGSNSLTPTTIPENVPVAPMQLLKLIRCSCDSNFPCRTTKCGCNSSKLGCTAFCTCEGGQTCCNDHTVQEDEDDTD